MDRAAKRNSNNAAAQRGLMVQRVLVDGWSAAAVAASHGVDERQVAALVAAYRRHGMAVLRDEALPQGALAGALHGARLLRGALARIFQLIHEWRQTGIGRSAPSRSGEPGRRDDDTLRRR